jgi:hypothetical protein
VLPARNAYSRAGTHKTMIVALARKLFIALWQLARHWRASSCVQQAESPEEASPDAYPLIRTYSALALAFRANCRFDDPRWRGQATDMAQTPTGRMGPPPRSFSARN